MLLTLNDGLRSRELRVLTFPLLVLERGYHFPFERDRPVRNALALAPPTLTPTR